MQTIQQPSSQHLPSQNATPSFDYQQTVEDFLNHCHLSQYLDIFLSEGFDSITSVNYFFIVYLVCNSLTK